MRKHCYLVVTLCDIKIAPTFSPSSSSAAFVSRERLAEPDEQPQEISIFLILPTM